MDAKTELQADIQEPDNLTKKAIRPRPAGRSDGGGPLGAVEDMPLAGVLAAAHAEVMNAIAGVYGGNMAAGCARLAAERVAGLQSFDEYAEANPLATMATRGRA